MSTDVDNVQFQKDWDERVQYIESALKKSGETYHVDDVYELVCAGIAHFEPLEDGAAVFLLHQYPQRRLLRIWLAGGVLPTNIERVLEAATKHASRLECDGIEVEGRRGWERILKPYGYDHKRAVLIKDLN